RLRFMIINFLVEDVAMPSEHLAFPMSQSSTLFLGFAIASASHLDDKCSPSCHWARVIFAKQ
ncbi:MAG: hypothetical protein ACTJGY_01270, partial [Glutamicibacter arilaitensis]|uniref:hypothetical protein n=1 Tax=Glutamicibacter arilaitensis TaxID=256701 RepID=UPI003FD20C33